MTAGSTAKRFGSRGVAFDYKNGKKISRQAFIHDRSWISKQRKQSPPQIASNSAIPPPHHAVAMGYFIRVVKGNVNEAARQLNRYAQADGHAKIFLRNKAHIKPCQARRQASKEGVRRQEKFQLLHNLRVVFARKARGF